MSEGDNRCDSPSPIYNLIVSSPYYCRGCDIIYLATQYPPLGLSAYHLQSPLQ